MYKTGSLAKAYVVGGLVKEIPTSLQDEEDRILHKTQEAHKNFHAWANQEHKFNTIRERPWLRQMHEGLKVFEDFIIRNEFNYSEYPLVLADQLREKFHTDVQRAVDRVRELLLETIRNARIPLPDLDIDMIKNRDPQYQWRPHLQRLPEQTLSSYSEQITALNDICALIDHLVEDSPNSVRCPILLGPPGAGKTFIMIACVIYALKRNLNVCLTALTGERALQMGGQHIHQLFCINEIGSGATTNANRIAENALVTLNRSPEKRAILLSMNVLAIEEIGLISLETLTAINIILKRLRKSNVPFGGVLVICTGDPRQLQPVSGNAVWGSTHIFTTFRIYLLKEYIRSMEDKNLMDALKLLQKVTLSEEEKEEFANIIEQHLPLENCVDSFSKVPPNATRVVSTNKAVQDISDEMTTLKKQLAQQRQAENPEDPDNDFETVVAVDHVETGKTSRAKAGPAAVRDLNRLREEKQKLFLRVKECYKFTVNDTSGKRRYTHGQLCILHKIIRPKEGTNRLFINVRFYFFFIYIL